jgi:hypothetical protein
MRLTHSIPVAAVFLTASVSAFTDATMDRVSDALAVHAFDGALRARLSGTVEIEGYWMERPAPGLIFTDRPRLLNPRFTLFFDAQWGDRLYAFAQVRADRGFDPSDENAHARFDEYALRLTPWTDGRFNVQVGKFGTVVGAWTRRHSAWENPFVTAPLPYENVTGLWDNEAPASANLLLKWAHVIVPPRSVREYADKKLRLPIIWGPSYATGAAISGRVGKFEYAAEVKNSALSSRPEQWDASGAHWDHPTYSGRVAYVPGPTWNTGFSASRGTYLEPGARPTLRAGYDFDDYVGIVLAHDVSFAWRHLQLWSEIIHARYEVPQIGTLDVHAYFLEGKYKFAPQWFGAIRWNQQLYGEVIDANGRPNPWGRDASRIDLAGTYRPTAHTQLKLQYSLTRETGAPNGYGHLLAAQFTLRF